MLVCPEIRFERPGPSSDISIRDYEIGSLFVFGAQLENVSPAGAAHKPQTTPPNTPLTDRWEAFGGHASTKQAQLLHKHMWCSSWVGHRKDN